MSAKLSKLELSKLLNDASLGNMHWGSGSGVRCPFELSPSQYLKYAEDDLKNETLQGDLNALHNAKRAINCAIDCVLWNFGFSNKHRINLPGKLELMRSIGLVSPRILLRIVKSRNLVEHAYKRIERASAEDAVDVAAMLCALMQPYAMYRYDEFYNQELLEYEIVIRWYYKIDAKDKQGSLSPDGIAYEFYRKSSPPLKNPAIRGPWIGDHLKDDRSEEDLLALGYEARGRGVVYPSEDDKYVKLITLIVGWIRQAWDWGSWEAAED